MSGSKIVGNDPNAFCPDCGDQAVLIDEGEGSTDYRCMKGHEWSVATDGGGRKSDDGDSGVFCPKCDADWFVKDEDNGSTTYQCENNHEWTVSTDGGLPTCETSQKFKRFSFSPIDAIESELERGFRKQGAGVQEGGS